MRATLRGMPDEDLLRLVRGGGDIVTVMMKSASERRGTSVLGESRLTGAAREETERQLNSHVAEVLYRFQHMPAAIVRLRSAQAAIKLRDLPWVDFVEPFTGELSADRAQALCTQSIFNAQTANWAIEKVRADHAWQQVTGYGSTILVLDDGLDLTDQPD